MPVRTFVALAVPEPWETYLAGLARDLARLVPNVSWTKPGNFHLTVRFLGDLEESEASRVGDAVARGLEGAESAEAAMGTMGAFPSLARPRVLWVGMAQGEPQLVALARRVNGAIDAAGFEREEKPFRPHLTLGRVREGRGNEAARGVEALRAYAPAPPPPAARLDRILVMKSDLHPSGARYTALREVRLPPQH